MHAKSRFDPIVPLSEALRSATQELHSEAERSGFIAEVLRRRADRHGYGLFIRNLVPVYRALEAALARHAGQPLLAVFAVPALCRAGRLANDARLVSGEAWEQLPLLPAGQAYAGHIAALDAQASLGLAGHAYVRYFGDLSGGQVVKKLLAQTMGLPPAALSHYDFPDFADLDGYKRRLRETLDHEPLRPADRAAVLEEAQRGFRFNIALSQSVQASQDAGGVA